MIHIKSTNEINLMRKGGEILKDVLEVTLNHVKEGIKLSELDKLAEEEIVKRNALPSFKMVKGYKWSICACVNEVVVHGVPGEYMLKKGDIIGIDCGVYYKGFHTDAAKTIKVGETNKKIERFLASGQRAIDKAIAKVKPGNYIYDISKAIQDEIEGNNYSVVRSLVGHGIGRQLHEEPEVPCFIRAVRKKTPKIIKGMVLAVEVIYNMGSPEVKYKTDDKWTIVTKDDKIAGLFEATVATTHHGCIILTDLS